MPTRKPRGNKDPGRKEGLGKALGRCLERFVAEPEGNQASKRKEKHIRHS